MGSGRFYALLTMLLFAAVCAYTGAAVFTALETSPGEAIPVPAISRGGELRGIILRREEKAPKTIIADAAERIAPGGDLAETALFFPDCDGYEQLSPADTFELNAEKLTKLMQTAPGYHAGAKLIYGFDCYYAAFYSGHEDIEPGPCRLKFEGETESRRAELLQVSKEDSGCTLLFRLLLDTELSTLRICSAQLIK